jgi:hypothetical protein
MLTHSCTQSDRWNSSHSSGKTLANQLVAEKPKDERATSDKIALAALAAFALFTIGFWTYAQDAERRARHGYLPALVALDPALLVDDDSDADRSLVSGGSDASDPTRP